MTPSQKAKDAGLKSLSQVSRLTGQSPQTLDNWAKNKPKLFNIVLLGCLARATQTAESPRPQKPAQ